MAGAAETGLISFRIEMPLAPLMIAISSQINRAAFLPKRSQIDVIDRDRYGKLQGPNPIAMATIESTTAKQPTKNSSEITTINPSGVALTHPALDQTTLHSRRF